MVFATLHDESKSETINLSTSRIRKRGVAKIGSMVNPDRYTNIVFPLGDGGQEVDFSGTFVPNAGSTGTLQNFPSTGFAWETSTGRDPIPTLEMWERLNTRLQYNDEVGSLTSCSIVGFSYKLIPGTPLTQIVYFELKLKESIEP